ncbi:hypothetical protein K435DRAFT_809548 [Dendrothele bispora CBS 962.96]|uniref:ABM domain-containing protein n=1 Tax=Dendrothele bispora (strain CBS 962.96) TaxID=1314807 RepID=A0A4S8KYA6_DENBC|nr:hypothetical protein K435DRAFT_809548 [Dendrothele bispora CBS 962.96]
MDLSSIPDKTSSGKLMVVTHLKIAPGREARYEELAGKVKALVAAGGEPKTLGYRVTRKVDKDGKPTGEYISIEEFTDKAGLLEHFGTAPAAELLKEVADGLFVQNDFDIVDEF